MGVASLALAKAAPIPEIVERCRELLAMAEAGEVRGIFVAYVGMDRTCGTVSNVGDGTEAVLYHAMMSAGHRMLSDGWSGA